MSRKYLLPIVVCLALASVSCSLPNFRNTKKLSSAARVQKTPPKAETLDPKDASDQVKRQFQDLFDANRLDEIERLAAKARNNKERLKGGYWKIDSIYEGLSTNYAAHPGQKLTDEMMQARIRRLKQWKEAHPDSVTPRVALGGALINYAWFIRGDGYIDSVSEADYDVFKDRLAEAEVELDETASMGFKCPRLKRELLFVGLANGWSEERFENLFDISIREEPDYLQYYLIKSTRLTPKWGGTTEEWTAFVNSLPEVLNRVGSTEADFVYLVVLANKVQDESLRPRWTSFDKDRIKDGTRQLVEKYGVDHFRSIQLGLLSMALGDSQLLDALKKS